MGKSVKKITGGATDLILGKKDKGTKDHYIALDPLQKKSLDMYGKQLDTNTDQMADSMAASQENQVRMNGMDAERRAQGLIAQRGLGNSSVGLNAVINSSSNVGNQISAIRAGAPLQKYQLGVDNLNNANAGISGILNSRTFVQGQASKGRQGGLAPIIGGVVGGAFGGAAGAQMGTGLGKAATQLG